MALKDNKIGNKYKVSRIVQHSKRMNDSYFTFSNNQTQWHNSLFSLCGMHSGSRGVLLAYCKCFVLHQGMEYDK